MPLNPILEAMLQQMADSPAMNEMSPTDAREMYRAMQVGYPVPELREVVDSTAGDVPIRVYRPDGEDASRCVVYFHAGGWVIGDLTTHDSVCRQLAEATGFTVIAVDYRLAPEHPFPAAIDDCYAATCWIAENAASLGIDAGHIAVAGDSAGGNLSASVCLKARQEKGPDIAGQLLIYPATDTAMDTGSHIDNAEGYLLTRDAMIWFWDHYLGRDGANRNNPLAAPGKADNLAGLPPACIITAEFDPLRDEGEAYAERLAAQGVATSVKRYNGMIHGFFGMTHLLEDAADAMDFAAGFLRAELKPHPR